MSFQRSVMPIVFVSFIFLLSVFPCQALEIPYYDLVKQAKTALYDYRWLEERKQILNQFSKLPDPYRATYLALYEYFELTTLTAEELPQGVTQFKQKTDLARLNLQNSTIKDEDLRKIFLGLIQGLKASVHLTVEYSYWNAYQEGLTGVQLIEQVHAQNPDFIDLELSQSIMSIMIARSSLMIRLVAPLIVQHGSLEEGFSTLNKIQHGARYVSEEADIFDLFLQWGDLPTEIRHPRLNELTKLTQRYPHNPQIYIFLARGFAKLNLPHQSNHYALKGLQLLTFQRTLLAERHRVILKAYLLRYHYDFLVWLQHWEALAAETQKHEDISGLSKAYQALAMSKLGHSAEAQQLKENALQQLQEERVLPLFMIPLQLRITGLIRQLLHEIVDPLERDSLH